MGIRQRLAQTEQLLLGVQSAPPNSVQLNGASPAPPDATGAAGARLDMRYSTPNLLLSNNLEHIMRLREFVS